MKKSKGFVLFETLVVSTFVLGTLIFLYTQISAIKRSYTISFTYNTVQGIYNANIVAKFLENDGYATIQQQLEGSSTGYLDITNCLLVNTPGLCDKIIDNIDARTVLITQNDITSVKNSLSSSNLTPAFQRFINRLPNTKSADYYRLIIEYNDNSYASVIVGEDNTLKTAYTLTNMITNSSFESDDTGWNKVGSSSTLSISEVLAKDSLKSATLQSSDTNNNKLSQSVTLQSDHIYFASQYVYTDSSISNANLNIYLDNSNSYANIDYSNLITKKWNYVSSLFTVTTGGSYSYNAINANSANNISVDNILLVDLTAAFGSENEPNKNWCDNHIRYFTSTKVIYE